MAWPFTTRRRLLQSQAQTVEALKALAMTATDAHEAQQALAAERERHRLELAARDQTIEILRQDLEASQAAVKRLERRLDGWIPADVATGLRYRVLQLEAQLAGLKEVGTCPQA